MKIVIVKLSALGDIVHAMIVLQFIKKYNKDIKIDWIVEECYKGLLDSNPDINKIHVVNLKKTKKKKSLFFLLRELKKVRQFGFYDLVIDMQGLIKSAIISKCIFSDATLGFDRQSAREGLSALFHNKTFKFGYDENVIERNLALLQFAIGFPSNNELIKTKLPFLYSSKNFTSKNLSKDKKNILIIPGASDPSKRYSVSKFSELIQLLDANYLIIWGDKQEKKIADEIKALSPKINVCKKISIDSLISLISQVDLIIGSDTGPVHMAWALNKASITLFGNRPGNRNTFITNINRVIESKSKVNPYKIDYQDYSINEIQVNDIVEVSKRLLDLNE
jgi:heptosyltransferase I